MLKRPYRITILGPQGSGKGTQAELLAKQLGIPSLSMGQMLRDEVARGGERGKLVDSIISKGHHVPAELSMDLFRERIAQPDCARGFIIDGFPRNLDQYKLYQPMGGPTHVVALELTDDAAVERLGGRLQCACGMIYHVKFSPPKKPGVCDSCGGKLERRHDDTPEVIRERLKLYHEKTEPLFARYGQEGILFRIDAGPAIPEVQAAIVKALKL